MFKNRSFWMVVLLFAATTCLSAQSVAKLQSQPSEKFLGAFSEGVYRNEFFKFNMQVPTEQFPLTAGEMSVYKEMGAKTLASSVKGNKAAWEKAASAEVIIFTVAEKQPGSAGNSSLSIGALKQMKGVSSRMVANTSKEFLLRNPTFKIVKETSPTKIAGKDFSVFQITGDFNGQTLNFVYYATIQNGYSLTFVITYLKTESLPKFEKMISTLTFGSK